MTIAQNMSTTFNFFELYLFILMRYIDRMCGYNRNEVQMGFSISGGTTPKKETDWNIWYWLFDVTYLLTHLTLARIRQLTVFTRISNMLWIFPPIWFLFKFMNKVAMIRRSQSMKNNRFFFARMGGEPVLEPCNKIS